MNRAYLKIIAAAALWGCIGVFLKLLTAAVVALFLAVPYWKGRYFDKARPAGKGETAHA